jgi:hypothetical protein
MLYRARWWRLNERRARVLRAGPPQAALSPNVYRVLLVDVVATRVGHATAGRDLVPALVTGAIGLSRVAPVAVLTDHERDRVAAVAVAGVALALVA